MKSARVVLSSKLTGFIFANFFVLTATVYASDYTEIYMEQSEEHEIRYTSGKTIYVERLVQDQWMGRYWSADGRIPFSYLKWADPAFHIEIKTDPAMGKAVSVEKGWQWVSSREWPKTVRGAHHFVVELTNTLHPVSVKVHTLLNGTPVLVRWLDITNDGDTPLALTKISPWSGRLWPAAFPSTTVPPFTLGHSDPEMEGWPEWYKFEWKPLSGGTALVESAKGNGFDDPFFIVRNERQGKYFIGHLAWSANWRLEFQCKTGLSFQFGPSAKDALRVIAPGETIETPAVHLGHVEGDLDSTVQAMHDHIRRFVLPTRSPELSYLIQFSLPSDQGYFRGHFNETNILKSIDVAAAVGAELFIIDHGWWDVYGEWVPSPSRLPNGLEPIVEYAHNKGLLFGLYAEVEGGRGNWADSKVFREHPDWFLSQNVLDLARPEVAGWMESEFTRLIDRYKLDLYRHDYIPNHPPLFTYEGQSTLRDGFMENHYIGHPLSVAIPSRRRHRPRPKNPLRKSGC